MHIIEFDGVPNIIGFLQGGIVSPIYSSIFLASTMDKIDLSKGDFGFPLNPTPHGGHYMYFLDHWEI